MAIYKLTPRLLKKFVLEEKAKLEKRKSSFKDDKMKHERDLVDIANNVDEVDSYASTLEKEIDYASALKVREAVLRAKLRKVRRLRELSKKKISKLLS